MDQPGWGVRGQAGIFTSSGQEIASGQTSAVFLADLEGDGDLDALIAGKSQAVIWWNDGRGTFNLSDQHFHYSKRHALAIGNFNGDGSPDIFAGAGSEAYSVWLNNGQGAFRLARL